ncbi:hypothetical protein DM01DRAFT_311168 [Hesseltinella vesiculosa]|uniref:Uncharacterized protein n=1 Tax=Hesseltinella vesiculosa TaxID=101127 RepID=A0A1X2G7R0_9FUNG|nr:hypothetical protein DM01DRAFT_311168 [Hesseltinella vesiculosa]
MPFIASRTNRLTKLMHISVNSEPFLNHDEDTHDDLAVITDEMWETKIDFPSHAINPIFKTLLQEPRLRGHKDIYAVRIIGTLFTLYKATISIDYIKEALKGFPAKEHMQVLRFPDPGSS